MKFISCRGAMLPMLLCLLLVAVGASAQQNGRATSRVAQLERAATLIGNNQLAEAERQLDQVLKDAPNEAAALNLLGALRAKQGKLDEAETFFARAVRSDARLTGAHMNLAYLYLLKGQPEQSAASLKEALRLDPTNVEAADRLAWVLLSQSRVDECIALIEKLKGTQTLSAPLLAVLGDAYLRKGEKGEALAVLKQAIALKPDEPSYRFALAAAWLKAPPDLQEAEESFRGFLRLRPDDAQGQLNLGYILLKQKKHGEAREWLERSIGKGAGTPEAFYYLGLIAQGQNEDSRSLELFERAVGLAPTFAHAHIALGATYLKLKDYLRAQQSLETGAKLSPEDSKAHYNLALLYARLKQPERAQEEMRIVERLKSDGKAGEAESDAVTPPR